jgi:TolB-like protein
MKHRSFFRFLCAATLLLYGSAAVQAGQVITREERDWAKQVVSGQAQPDEVTSSKSIAVLNFQNRTGQKRLDALQKGMALLVIHDLAKIESITVIERTRMQALLDEVQPGAGNIIDDAAAPSIGKQLNAYYVVNGAITEGSIEQLAVQASLIDVPFGTSSVLPKAAGPVDELYRIQKDVLFHVLDSLNIYLPTKERRGLEVPPSASTPALLAFFLGIDASDREQYRQAADLYTRALAEDPSFDLAREALQELTDRNLLVDLVEAPPVAPGPESLPSPPDSEMSSSMKIGLGVAAVAGGVALIAAAGGGGGGGGGSSEPPPAEPEPTVTIDTTGVTCAEDAVTFTFSEPMDTRFGYTDSSDASFTVTGSWLDVQHYRTSWSGQETFCEETPTSVDIILTNFQNEEGTPLSGQTTFTLEFE